MKQHGDSDSDEFKLARRNPGGKYATKRTIPEPPHSSDDDSDKDNFGVSHLKAGNFADLANDSFYLHPDSQETKNIRVVPRSRPTSLLRPSSNAVKPTGFVPKEVKAAAERGGSGEWKQKSMRIMNSASNDSTEGNNYHSQTQNFRDRTIRQQQPTRNAHNDEDAEDIPSSWAKAPKKFLGISEDDQEEQQQRSRGKNNRSPVKNNPAVVDWNNASKANKYRVDEDNRTKANKNRPVQPKYEPQGEDVVSQHSAESLEENRYQNYNRKKGNNRNLPLQQQQQKKRQDDLDEEFEEQQQPSQQQNTTASSYEYNPNSVAKNRMKEIFNQQRMNDEQEEAFMTCASHHLNRPNNSNHNEEVLPRKSGGYEEGDNNEDWARQGGSRGGNNLQQWTSRQGQYQIDPDEQEADDQDRQQEEYIDEMRFSHNRRNNNETNKPPSRYSYSNARPASKGGNSNVSQSIESSGGYGSKNKGNNNRNGWVSGMPGSSSTSAPPQQQQQQQQRNNNFPVASNVSSGGNSSNTIYNNMSAQHSFVLIAHPQGIKTRMVQCTIARDRSSIHGKLYPSYELILEEPRKTLIIARKMSMNRTSNYHLFDMTRGIASQKLSKKAGNYLGKLRAKNMNRTGYSLLNHKENEDNREEIAGVLFDRITLMDQINEGNQPRKMQIIIPLLNEDSIPIPIITANTYGIESLPEMLSLIDDGKLQTPNDLRVLHTKEPVFENGNYRLNFHGRVSMPSVKNFQMVSDDNIGDVKCQFGKVDKDIFHLDYKEPFNAVQAFALALCQFNL